MDDLRIARHPVLGPNASGPVTIVVNGEQLTASSSDTVASALWANGIRTLRRSRSGEPRGIYCGIGHCFECRVAIDGEMDQRSCLTAVRPGMQIETETRT